MIPVGDDFSYTNGHGDFEQVDVLKDALEEYARGLGYNAEVKYNSLYSYFEEIKDMDLEFKNFKGDFLPLTQTYEDKAGTDFWTGFYSTRPHIKAYITHTFHQIQSLKTLYAIKAVESSEHGDIDSMSDIIKDIEKLMKLAERKWAITLHHDAITGTHTEDVGEDYYRMLIDANELIHQAHELIITNLGNPISEEDSYNIARYVLRINEEDQIDFLHTYTVGKHTHQLQINPVSPVSYVKFNFSKSKCI
jgi:hypothetical protein